MDTNSTDSGTTHVIDTLLDDLSEMAEDRKTTPNVFFEKIVITTESLLSPISVAILSKRPDGGNLLIHGSTSLAHRTALPEMEPQSSFTKFLSDDSKRTVAIIDSGTETCIVSSIRSENKVWGGMVARFEKSANVEPLAPVFDAIREIVAQFILNQIQQNSFEFLQNFLRFTFNAHSSVDPKLVANHLANDARIILNCERLSIFQIVRNRPKLLAISSVSSIENRSSLAKKMIRFANAACHLKKPAFTDQPPTEKSLHDALSGLQATSGFSFITGLPLVEFAPRRKTKPGLVGFLIAESDDSISRLDFSRGIRLTTPHIGLALENSRAAARIPFRRPLSMLGRLRDRSNLPTLLMTAAVLGIVVWTLFFLKTDFQIRIHGELRPSIERSVFSPADGFIDNVRVNHGDTVQTNQVLIELSSPTLNLELKQLSGEQLKNDKMLEAKKITLNQATSRNMGDQVTLGELASDISELEQEQEILAQKKKFLLERISDLVIVSPIDGRVTTWQLKRNLLKKPVQWGEELTNIAYEEGSWELGFKVPEHRIGYLLEARENSNQPLEIEFFFESNPNQKMKTRIIKISNSTELDPEYGSVVTVICEIPAANRVPFIKRHGARVIADVNCGDRPVWRVWTQELTDSIKRWMVW